MRLHEEYAVPSLYVTENGAAFADVRTHDGRVHDLERVAYLRDHVAAVADAVAAATRSSSRSRVSARPGSRT